jgi:hypothetical protein
MKLEMIYFSQMLLLSELWGITTQKTGTDLILTSLTESTLPTHQRSIFYNYNFTTFHSYFMSEYVHSPSPLKQWGQQIEAAVGTEI